MLSKRIFYITAQNLINIVNSTSHKMYLLLNMAEKNLINIVNLFEFNLS